MDKTDCLQKVTVIIPTLNANGPLLSKHIEGLNRWIQEVGAVIVVDSQSTDGTVEYIRENLSFDRIRFFERPRGLYQAWNFAIREVATEFLYVATVGDIIEPEGVERLVDTIESFCGDIVISPPDYRDMHGSQRTDIRWPVDVVGELLLANHPCELSSDLVCALHTFQFPSTLAGSSASNLYRTKFLQENPFPLDFGNQGDSAWAVQASSKARWCFHPNRLATLVFHPRVKSTSPERKAQTPRGALWQNLCGVIEREPQWRALMNDSFLTAYFDFLKLEASVRERWVEVRNWWLPWYLRPSGWQAQLSRKRVLADRERLKEGAVEVLKKRFQPPFPHP